MKRQQIILITGGVAALLCIYFLGQTVPAKKGTLASQNEAHTDSATTINTEALLSAAKKKLTSSQQAYISGLEASVVRGDVKAQQIRTYNQLATFWKDSVGLFQPSAYYTAEAAKLENSEKSLTFAARLFLTHLRGIDEPELKSWEASQAKELFEKALALNPANDSTKIGLGSCYIFGSTAANPTEIMQGIQQILEVARRDSTNMYAQLMLGIGGVVSGQLDKAVERLEKVVKAEPHNMEAVFMLAEAYERKGDKANAIKWYEIGKRHVPNKDVVKEIEERIETLKK